MSILANGQLASSDTTVFTNQSTPPVVVSMLMQNTSGSQTETVVVHLTPSGGTERRIGRWVLAPNEQAVIEGLSLGTGDAISGNSTDGSVVDYTLSTNQVSLYTLDSTGALKQVNSGVSGNQTIAGTLAAKLLQLTPQPADVYAATMTIDVTYGSHIIAAINGTSATVAFTPSGAGSAGQLLLIVTEADASGTVTATFASTFHPSATQVTTASHFSTALFVSDGTRWCEVCRTTNLA